MKIADKNITLLLGVFKDDFLDELKRKKLKRVYVCEGRPGLESAKENAKQLIKRKIEPVIISDNMAGFLFYNSLVKEVWLAAQKTDAQGAVCPIGGLILAVLGKNHRVPVRVSNAKKETELFASTKEICKFNGIKTAPSGTNAFVPLVEWVPNKYLKRN